MNALWFSYVAIPKKNELLSVPHNGPVAVATTAVNMNIINKLVEQYNFTIDLMNTYPAKVFPRSNKVFIAKQMLHVKTNLSLNEIGFINLPVANHISKSFQLVRSAQRWAVNHQGPGIVFVYSVHSPFLLAAAAAKQHNRQLHICLLVPDLPEYMDIELDKKPVKRLLKKLDSKIIVGSSKYIDSYVLFSRHMTDRLPIGKKPYIVMEGIVDPGDFSQENNKSMTPESPKIIMYSGLLQVRYGIPHLLQAFMKIPGLNYRLWITGDGNAREMVETAQKSDSRIQYWGFVEDRRQVLQMQQQATLMINMRLPSEIQSAYCFPSKLLEYMASGTPTLTHRIPGIPDEYHDYLFFLEDEDPVRIAAKIQEILHMPESKLREVGSKARKFVLMEKNASVQTNRIVRMIADTNSSVFPNGFYESFLS